MEIIRFVRMKGCILGQIPEFVFYLKTQTCLILLHVVPRNPTVILSRTFLCKDKQSTWNFSWKI